MGQTKSRRRLEVIKENVDEITEKIKSKELSADDRGRSHDILLDYIKEIKFILSKSLRASRIRKAEKLIIAALQELATLEGNVNHIEPRLKAKSLQTLHDIEQDMKNISAILTNQNIESEKETVNKYKKRISLIDDVDQEVGEKKNSVLDAVCSVENVFNELEVEENVKTLEEKHYHGKVDITRFVGVSESACYKKHKEHLLSLKEQTKEIPEVSAKISERKKYLLFNIDNNIAALDKKVKENEAVIKKQEKVFRTTTSISEKNLIENVVCSYTNFEKSFSANCSINELEDIFRKLSELKMKIDQKLMVLGNQIQGENNPFLELVPLKKQTDSKNENLDISQIINKLKDVGKAVEDMHQEIVTSTHSQESFTYANYRKKLQKYRHEIDNLHLREKEEQDDANNTLGQIDKLLLLLENNNKSTTGDVLIDIMSVSTNVNESGNNIQRVKKIDDCEYIETELLENLYYLQKLEIPSTRSNVRKFRDYVIIQIDSYLSNLEKIKKSFHQSKIVQAKNEEMLSF